MRFLTLFLLLTFLLIPLVSATVTVPSTVHFGYGNGTYFIHSGTYNSVERINSVWYFDGVAYGEEPPPPPPPTEWPPAVSAIFFVVLPIIFMVAIITMFVRDIEKEQVTGEKITAYVVSFVLASILIPIALNAIYG